MFAVIGDLYYVHERGTRVAALTIAISGVANLPAVLSGLVTDRLGWRWNFWMLAIFLGLGLGLVLLFAWETAFERHQEAVSLDIHPAEVRGQKIKKSPCSHDSVLELILASRKRARKLLPLVRRNVKPSRTLIRSASSRSPITSPARPSGTVCLRSQAFTPTRHCGR
jgi:MFS family permease